MAGGQRIPTLALQIPAIALEAIFHSFSLVE
jgi:hypothetical protein